MIVICFGESQLNCIGLRHSLYTVRLMPHVNSLISAVAKSSFGNDRVDNLRVANLRTASQSPVNEVDSNNRVKKDYCSL